MKLHGETAEERLPDRWSDSDAIEYITSLLDGETWTPTTLDEIADAIRRTGREVGDPEMA